MPTFEWNSSTWDGTYDWSEAGEEWSELWGGSESQWYGCILSRIGRWLPAPAVLEIAPGYGRWTRFLLKNCTRFTGIDLSAACVNFCQKRFSGHPNAEFHVNDGRSLSKVVDGSIDFVFSFDSLVHVEADIIETYVRQIARKLKPQGVGLIHHSNLGACSPETPNRHMRARSMTAGRFAEFCDSAGLACISQETVNWGQPEFVDCLSMFTAAGSCWERSCRRLENPRFMLEAEMLSALAPLYHPPPPTPGRADAG
jgi:SAM-dependent methyltransferase